MKIDVQMLERMNVDDFMEKCGLSLSITEQQPNGDSRFLIRVEGINRHPSLYPIGMILATNIASGMQLLFKDLSTRTIYLESNPDESIKVPVLTWTSTQLDDWARLAMR